MELKHFDYALIIINTTWLKADAIEFDGIGSLLP